MLCESAIIAVDSGEEDADMVRRRRLETTGRRQHLKDDLQIHRSTQISNEIVKLTCDINFYVPTHGIE